jgi:hypothetical protein
MISKTIKFVTEKAIVSFLKRKKTAQSKTKRDQKDNEKGKKPVFIKKGLTEVKEFAGEFKILNESLIPVSFTTIIAKNLFPSDLIISESGEMFNINAIELIENKFVVDMENENKEAIKETFDAETIMGFIGTDEGFERDDAGNFMQIHEDQNKKVKLNKIMPGDVKKYKVYVKNDKGNVVKVNFGDPNMEIKRDNPARRKNFRARHNCDNPGPRWKARYWACKTWSSQSVTSMLKENVDLNMDKPKEKVWKKLSTDIANKVLGGLNKKEYNKNLYGLIDYRKNKLF